MSKVKFIYNPYSGEKAIISQIDKVIRIHQKYGYEVVPYRISLEYNLDDAFKSIDESYKYILVAGGDGTVDNVVNHLKKFSIDLPIAILPTGTANDFAKFIGMSTNVGEACEQILRSSVKKIDLGKINDKYFINVASTGLFTDVSQKTDVNLKNTMGKLAYYVKGLEQLPNFRRLKVNVKSEEVNFDGDMYLMMVFNGQTAGNLHMAYKAEVDDGMLDVIIIKACAIKDMIGLFIKMIKGDHLEDVNALIYFKTNKLEIESNEEIVTDIDGERGPDFPLQIECVKEGLDILGILD
ncbi:YegS/Rv2252/BmrU family lipid kinase [Clostridium botulinum]|uniref:YegS/Rv2252/BmrU family lipid kinase n=2 Tax=Clostridium botulinum TaxID=1491 RepID=A0A846HTS6_CLOBO|nr:YegS/Rv2252/BmrU family lipid kinase [Clostridium botulinum]AJD28402.1 lipid kinase, YegS//BmrU family protein [Clostridium botulinum CDC_297]EPS48143.1 lipid kinase [Clostridium botulinum A1 str. CFSAN002368]ACQ53206.1 lipid kinase, YegS/Rv2252/BmrU family [Clostridium botulinum Ba4 str. 657]AJE12083.1 lipid kinase, YegS//BmrU family protein [Clostridium botulinum CDC_1436]APR02144.1 lipid kinase, YegS//BmrU family protein [Clostridium botulinum]